MIYIFLIIIIITILFNVINNLNKKKKIEYFESSSSSSASWSQSSEDVNKENQGLTSYQENQVKNISSSISKDILTNLIQTQSPLLAGPHGPTGPPGPAGTTLIASGKLANKTASFNEKNKTIPQLVVSRIF